MEGGLLLAEEHLRGESVIRGWRRVAGRAEEARRRRIQRTPIRRHHNDPGPSPNFLGEAMPVASAAVAKVAAGVAAQREMADDACVVEGVVERGAHVMARCVKGAGGLGFHSGLGVAVAHCAVAVPVQNSSCHCVMECREVAGA